WVQHQRCLVSAVEAGIISFNFSRCFAKSFGQQAARRSKSTAVWQVEGVAPRHPHHCQACFIRSVVKGKWHSLRSPLTKSGNEYRF
ncbi:hypothetical protein, partial [Escherichia coli]|uniref:hypothetical protein n=1 Tax=Escherichia coli TaxID=562 RepID=UPI0022F0CC69